MAEIAQAFLESFADLHSALLLVAGCIVGGSLLVSAAVFTVALVLLAKRK